MRRRLLVFLAICAAFAALAPEPAPARSLLGLLLGVRVHRGHHHHYAYRYHRRYAVHYARRWGTPRWRREAARAVVPAAAAAGAGAAAATSTTPAAAAALYWPGAYQDLVGFTFVSGGGADNGPFWGHGSRDIFTAIIAPPDSAGPPHGPPGRAAGEGIPEPAQAQACASTNADAADAAFKQIEDRLAPTSDQRPAFDDLHDAMVRAQTRINATCAPSFATAAPPERMKAISDLLWALRQAMLTLRTPLERAYKALDDRQRARLNTPGFKVACTGDAVQLSWPRDQIEQVIQPNDQQRVALEALRVTSLQMAQAIAFSCPRQPLTNPLQRLDAAGDRANTMLYAAMIVGRALGNVYASLSDQQKANFSTLGHLLANPHAAEAEAGAR